MIDSQVKVELINKQEKQITKRQAQWLTHVILARADNGESPAANLGPGCSAQWSVFSEKDEGMLARFGSLCIGGL